MLKLFIHGRNDTLFESKLLNEKVAYYCYLNKLDGSYEERLTDKYEKLFKPKLRPEQLQDRFVFAIPWGQHSVHKQERNQGLIR